MDPKAKWWTALVATTVVIGLALLLSAGTIDYWQAWVFLGVNAVSSVLLTLFVIEDPILLESRTRGGPTAEKRSIQRVIVLLAGLPTIAAFVVPGLDRRFGWSSVPPDLWTTGSTSSSVCWTVSRSWEKRTPSRQNA